MSWFNTEPLILTLCVAV